MRSLCSGSTRANTRTCSTIASSSASPMVRSSAPVTSRAPGSKMSSSRAIASAVAGWSPVIITVRMCARLAMATAAFDLGARRIDHADQAEQHEIVLDALRQLDRRNAAAAACGSTPKRPPARCAWRSRACAAPGRRARRCAATSSARRSSSSGTTLPSSHDIAAFREQDLRRALDEDAQLVRASRDRRWTVVWRLRSEVKGISAMRGKRASSASVDAELARRDDQRAFGRVALHAPAPLAVA